MKPRIEQLAAKKLYRRRLSGRVPRSDMLISPKAQE